MKSLKHTLLLSAAIVFGLASAVGASVGIGNFGRFTEVASASVPKPKANEQLVFIDSADHQLKRKTSSNTVTTIEGGGGGGGVTTTVSIVDLANAGATVTDGAGSYTYGDTIVPLRTGLVMTGVRVYWPGGHGALTYKLGLYNSGGLVTSVNVSINAAGVYTGTFASPQTLSPWVYYRVSAWETSGARNIYLTGANLSTFTSSLMAIADINGKVFLPGYFRVASCYAAGDANPTSADNTLIAGIVEPVFQ